MGGSIFLTLFFGLFLLIGLAVLGYGARSYYFSSQAEHWPTTPGRITASDFVVNSDSDGATYRAKVEYTYRPDHIERTGTNIAFGYTASSGEAYHREIYKALPVGTQVAVRYDPSKPDRAALSYGVNKSIIFMLIFGGVWTFFTLGMAAMFTISESGAGSLLSNMIIYSTGR